MLDTAGSPDSPAGPGLHVSAYDPPEWPELTPLARARLRLGASSLLWAGEGVRMYPDRWSAISGVHSVDHNVVVCYGTGDSLQAGLQEGLRARIPFVMMLAGSALGEAQRLIDIDWVCVGSVPFMRCSLTTRRCVRSSPQARMLGRSDLTDVRRLVDEAFGVGPELACRALPVAATTTPGEAVWGISDNGKLVSCLAAVRIRDSIAIWWMSTPPTHRRTGHAARLLEAVLAAAADDGAQECLLYASTQGEPFWRAVGFEQLERWQVWSRPRWMLGRA